MLCDSLCRAVTHARAFVRLNGLVSAFPDQDRILYNKEMAKTVPFSDARARLSELLDEVHASRDHVVITRNGRPVALLMSLDEYESLELTIEVLSDEDTLEALRESEEDVKAGRTYSLEEVKRDLGLA